MDLGATAVQRAPGLRRLPAGSALRGPGQGRPEAYPVKTRAQARQRDSTLLLWLALGDRVWLVQRPDTGVWAGLWSLPEFDDAAALGRHGWLARARAAWLPPFVHVLTHLDWTLQPCTGRCLPTWPKRSAAIALAAGPGVARWPTRWRWAAGAVRRCWRPGPPG
jgi:A/G-specific adenine glycosylase